MKIIFIPGITGSKHNFDILKNYFPDCKAIDIIGFGNAPKPEATYNKEFFMRYLERMITEKVVLVGHSMGAIIAKDFAVLHPELVEKLFLISYPLQKDKETLKNTLSKNKMTKHYIEDDWYSRFIDFIKDYDKFITFPIARLINKKKFPSFRDSYYYTHNSIINSIRNYILQDDSTEISKIKDKAVFITGEKDYYTDLDLLKGYKSYVIPDMPHVFLGFEEKIAKIIKEVL